MDHSTEVCVVGAGIAGLTTAYLLLKEGRRVIVLDDGLVGGGESGLTTAHLTTALDRRWAELAKLHSAEDLRVAATSHGAAIRRIGAIVADEEIDCDFQMVPGYLFAGQGQSSELIREEVLAAQRAGLGLVRQMDRAPLLDFDTGPAARFPEQGQLHALRYLAGLARAIERAGGQIYTRAHVTEVDEESEPGQVVVKTDRDLRVRAGHVVLATNTPFLPRISLHLKQTGYRSYVIALPIPPDSVFPALYWDTDDPLHYVRVTSRSSIHGPEPLLVVGGEDHKTGLADDTDQRHARLEAWTRPRFPKAGPVLYRWSGEVMETIDGLAYIGRIEEGSRIFVATGDCGNGMTHGTIAGILINDLIQGRPSDWAKTYDPTRTNLSVGAVSSYVKENLSTAAGYADWLTGGDIADVEELAPGTGAIMRRGLRKMAVYRDPQGRIHERSAVCPHLGGIVAWNQAERTWDCPCHASRFDCKGRVIHGPATADLAEVEADAPPESESRGGAELQKTG